MNTKQLPLFGFLASLYIAQGLPAGLASHALPVLLREQDVSLSLVTLTNLLALPWLFKFLWAPFLDSQTQRFFTLLLIQVSAIIGFAVLAIWPLSFWLSELGLLFIVLMLSINVLMASHDVLTDGSAVRLLDDSLKGIGNTFQVGGYKLGMIVGGSGLLWLMDRQSWSTTILSIVALNVVVLFFVVILGSGFKKQINQTKVWKQEKPSTRAIWQHWLEYFSLPNIMIWLLIVITFKLGDSLASSLIRPFWYDQGLSKTWIGEVGTIGIVASLVGAILGGLMFRQMSTFKALVLSGFLQALGLSLYGLCDFGLIDKPLWSSCFYFEQVVDGISTVVLFAAMMKACRIEFAGGDYTIQASLFLGLTGLLKILSGLFAEMFGYALVFVFAALVFLITFVLLLEWRRRGEFLQLD